MAQIIHIPEMHCKRDQVNPHRPMFDQRTDLILERCTGGCGHPLHLHWNQDGIGWIGCEGAIKRVELGTTYRSSKPLSIWGDQYPDVSRAITNALLTSCGTSMQELFGSLGLEERVQIARRLAEITVQMTRTMDAEGR